MGWLASGPYSLWSHRIRCVIPDYVDENLDDFLFTVRLDGNTGRNNADLTIVLDELGGRGASYAKRKKIAATESDGTTQLYVEIQSWNDENDSSERYAVLKIRASTMWSNSGSSQNVFYLYYDSSVSDNTTYVGDVQDAVPIANAHPNYSIVYGCNEDLADSPSTLKDSNNVVDLSASGNTATVRGVSGDCAKFLGGGEATGTINELFSSNDFIIQFWLESWQDIEDIILIQTFGVGTPIEIYTEFGELYVSINDNDGNGINLDCIFNYDSTQDWHLITVVRNGADFYLYIDYTNEDDASFSGFGALGQNGTTLTLGASNGDFKIDDVRISSGIVHSLYTYPTEWLKAQYYDGKDDFIYFYAEAVNEADDDLLFLTQATTYDDVNFVAEGKTLNEVKFAVQGYEEERDQLNFRVFSSANLTTDLKFLVEGATVDDLLFLTEGKTINELLFLVKGSPVSVQITNERRLSLYKDTLDLRDTSVYAYPRKIEYLPLLIGDFSNTKVPCTPLDRDGYIYHISDFNIHSISSVQVDGTTKTYGFAKHTSYQDSAGYPIGCVIFDEPQYDATITVHCKGIVKATGELIETPADLIKFILLKVQKYSSEVINYNNLYKYAAACKRNDIKIAGRIEEPVTLRNFFDEIVHNVWSRYLISDGKQNVVPRWD